MNVMLISSGMSQVMWGAILSANFLLNKIPFKNKDVTPYELWWGHKSSYKYLKVWGCLAKVIVTPPKALRIGPKTVDCIFIGYAKNGSSHRFLVYESKNPDVHKDSILETRPGNATYFEGEFPMLEQTHATHASSSTTVDKIVQEET